MDALTKELQSFLVRVHYYPESISHQMSHYVEHLVRLLPPEEEDTLLHYFGILDHEQKALDELAHDADLSAEDMIQQIDKNLRKLAITPEWLLMKQSLESHIDKN